MRPLILALFLALALGSLAHAADPLRLCVKADRLVQGQPREGAKIVLRAECKKRSNGTPIEISIGTSDSIGEGGGPSDSAQVEFLSNLARELTCGDGVVEPRTGEECDDDNRASNDGCSNDCLAGVDCDFSGESGFFRLMKSECPRTQGKRCPSMGGLRA